MGDEPEQGPTEGTSSGGTAPVGPGLRIPVGAPGRRPPAPGGDDGAADERDRPSVASLYETVGGQPFFDELARRFYEEVRSDEVLLALYPDPEDLGPAAERLALFLAQYWGGPTTYSDRRGHPRLRMRHAPYRIGGDERDRWLRAVTTALAATVDPTAGHLGELDAAERSQVERQLLDYLTMAADHLVNDPS